MWDVLCTSPHWWTKRHTTFLGFPLFEYRCHHVLTQSISLSRSHCVQYRSRSTYCNFLTIYINRYFTRHCTVRMLPRTFHGICFMNNALRRYHINNFYSTLNLFFSAVFHNTAKFIYTYLMQNISPAVGIRCAGHATPSIRYSCH
jgi:hypothetical protein